MTFNHKDVCCLHPVLEPAKNVMKSFIKASKTIVDCSKRLLILEDDLMTVIARKNINVALRFTC